MARVYPIDHPLRSAWLKIRRAQAHINALERSVARHLNKQTAIRQLAQPEKGFRISTPPTLERWSVVIGDIVTNLRDSLDHIAWALAVKQATDRGKALTPEQAKGIYFPLKVTPDKIPLIGGLSENALHFFPGATHVNIEKFQPYNHTNCPKLKLLDVLDKLAGLDKHRVVTPTYGQTIVRGIPGQGRIISRFQDEHGRPMERVAYDLQPVATSDIIIRVDGSLLTALPVRRGLREIHDFIQDEVLPTFAGFLK